jgi:hypothetical protein
VSIFLGWATPHMFVELAGHRMGRSDKAGEEHVRKEKCLRTASGRLAGSVDAGRGSGGVVFLCEA